MATYKGREVTVVGPTPLATNPPSINIRHKDGSNEHVRLDQVSFTKDEKNHLNKNATIPSNQ